MFKVKGRKGPCRGLASSVPLIFSLLNPLPATHTPPVDEDVKVSDTAPVAVCTTMMLID